MSDHEASPAPSLREALVALRAVLALPLVRQPSLRYADHDEIRDNSGYAVLTFDRDDPKAKAVAALLLDAADLAQARAALAQPAPAALDGRHRCESGLDCMLDDGHKGSHSNAEQVARIRAGLCPWLYVTPAATTPCTLGLDHEGEHVYSSDPTPTPAALDDLRVELARLAKDFAGSASEYERHKNVSGAAQLRRTSNLLYSLAQTGKGVLFTPLPADAPALDDRLLLLKALVTGHAYRSNSSPVIWSITGCAGTSLVLDSEGFPVLTPELRDAIKSSEATHG